MWNKLFRKRSKSSTAKRDSQSSTVSSEVRVRPTTTKCFSFGRKFDENKSTYTLSSDNFQYLRYESQTIHKPPDYNDDNEYPQLYQSNQQPDENQQLNEIFIEIPPPNLYLEPCPVCSRKFSVEALRKHIVICERVSTKKRKPFDSSRQRLKGTEFTGVLSSAEPTSSRVSPPKTLSRKASETSLKSTPGTSTFTRSVLTESMRKSSASLTGTPKPLMKRSISQQQQNEKCPYCQRTFGFKAFDRHVEWCKEKSLIKDNPDCPAVSAAKERLKTRIHYRAPNLKTKKSLTREKYSNSCNGSTHSLDFDGMINSMSSSMTSESGLYDPFLSAKRQLEELFPPEQKTKSNAIEVKKYSSAATTPTVSSNSSSLMSKSLTMNSSVISPKTPQPVSKLSNNFRRTSSLRISNKKSKPSLFPQPVKSNIQKGITDEGPVSPNFVKSADYDELPIKSPYSAIKMIEKPQVPRLRTPSPASSRIATPMPSIVMRDKSHNLLQRKNQFKLEIKNPNMPSDYSLSKTDSLALFLKYEQDLKASAKLTEKELKDKSNKSIMAKADDAEKDHKLPDINGKTLQRMTPTNSINLLGLSQNNNNYLGNQPLISVDKLNQTQSQLDSPYSNHSGPKLMNACDNLSISTKSESPERIGDNKPHDGDDTSLNSTGSSKRARTRQVKLSKENILFNTEPEPEVKPDIRSESRASNTESIFEDFDFNEFISSFNDDDQFPIFKDYKALLSRSKNEDACNNNSSVEREIINDEPIPNTRRISPAKEDFLNGNRKPEKREIDMEIPGLDKLENLGKLMGNPSDSDESTSNEVDPIEHQTVRSKSSADSAYGSLSRQSPLDYRKNSNGTNHYTFRNNHSTPYRTPLELKTTEIHLSPSPMRSFVDARAVREQTEELSDQKLSKFCHECGYRFVVSTAKFCIECGVRRIRI